MNADGSPKYHPVICHLADTAAVAMEIMRSYLSPIAVERLSNGLGLSYESTLRFCCFMAGSHDLGKVSPAFQFQVSDVGRALVGETLYDCWFNLPASCRKPKNAPHGTVTAATLPEFLTELGVGNGLRKSQAKKLTRKLAAIVGGHHGFFPSLDEIQTLDSALSGTNSPMWHRHSSEIFHQLKDFVGLTISDLPSQCDNAAAMILAGLTTVSDWLASNEDNFPYANDEPFDQYQKGLKEKAQQALKKQGWTQHKDGNPLEFSQLFGFNNPRELQKAAIAVSKDLKPPCLLMVEASMGEGKTEAALYLADYLQHQTSAGGFYIGLPTQATSNAMYERVQEFLGKRYSGDVVNLTLSHSAAALTEGYQSTVCRLDEVYDDQGKVVASEWHTARKRTLLSPYGVGTIDQALMGVVRSRHQFVRLFGLAGRTVILDEIHAYDAYTGTLLERFLEWLALLGSPVIALSATLPKSTRLGLLKAYAQGSGIETPKLPQADYPRITALSSGVTQAKSFEASPHVCRELGIRWVDDTNWVTDLHNSLLEGGCVAIICSTINRAQQVYEQLKLYFETKTELGLFHGRFLFKDREIIETKCRKQFGKNGDRPQKYVLVATQVIEQSLDVDFDLMISHLAPIDLLLQRSGRLHRHERKNRPSVLKSPNLWIVNPTMNEQGKIDFGDSGYIYDRHVLLRSWLTLRERSSLQLPGEMDSLIESVYDLEAPIPENLEPDFQEDWQVSLADYEAKTEDSHWAKANQVKLPPARADNNTDEFTRLRKDDDDSTVQAVTRLGEESITTIFLQRTEQGLCFPNGEGKVVNLKQTKLADIKQLLAHSTRISKKEIVKALKAQDNPPEWTSALLRHCRYLELNANGEVDVGKWHIRLDPEKGVMWEK
jgi:CRISPR-associated endonuclease/helicase Cas3